MSIKHDISFHIARGRNRNTKNWKNTEMLWSAFLEAIGTTQRTHETIKEYLAADKDRQAEIKDVGGYVGGYLAGGRRLKGKCLHRQLLTLDVDFGTSVADVLDELTMIYGCAAAVYTTHKHTPESPRLRLIIPIDAHVGPEEYEAISRRIAGNLDIEIFDRTTFQPERLMYWPSTAKDGEYIVLRHDGPVLNAQSILDEYFDWKDTSEWPVSIKEDKAVRRGIDKQGDPLEKPGAVGAFCRTYTIHEAIAQHLGDKYTETDADDRYTYTGGSTAAGLITYDDKYAYSHHGTDPISGKLCNAFDLVRIHKFGIRDEDAAAGTPGNRLPSYQAMIDLATADKAVRVTMGEERLLAARDEFAGIDFTEGELKSQPSDPESTEWLGDMEADRNGYLNTISNVLRVFENDPYFKGRIGYDDFQKAEVCLKPIPWRIGDKQLAIGSRLVDSDDSSIRQYLEDAYKLTSTAKITDAQAILSARTSFHPVKEYLGSLSWDGTHRLDSLLIDYMGAPDTPYTRAVTRKALCAGVARIYRPGVKFDCALGLIGGQGRGKSTLISKLGRDWFSDNFTGVHGNKSIEQLQGVWIIEIPELAGFKKAEVEAIKAYISKRVDRYRVAYGKRVEEFPRQCIFIFTSNEDIINRDQSGGRRWWPVMCGPSGKSVFTDLSEEEVGQIWAEAVIAWNEGEALFLSPEIEADALKIQERHTERDDRAGIIEAYLNTLLPENWEEMDRFERQSWLHSDDLRSEGTVERERVCAAEVYVEALGGRVTDVSSQNTKVVHDVLKKLPGWIAKGRTGFAIYGNQMAYFRIKLPKMTTANYSKEVKQG